MTIVRIGQRDGFDEMLVVRHHCIVDVCQHQGARACNSIGAEIGTVARE